MSYEDYLKNEFNKKQYEFITSNIESCKVIGNPGCGKTKSIIEYCIHKFNKGLITSFRDFVILSFSKAAVADFIKKGKNRLKNGNINLFNKKINENIHLYEEYNDLFNKNNIRTIHSLAAPIYNHLMHNGDLSLNTIILGTYNLLNTNSKNDNKLKTQFNNIKFIIVDEAQDLNENQYNLIKRISEILNCACILVGDPNQCIYQFQNSSCYFLINHSKKKYPLVKNYRSNKLIINLLNHFRPHNKLDKIEYNDMNIIDKQPIIICDTRDNISKYIIDKITNSEYNREDIAIIGPVKLSKNGKSFGLQYILNILANNNIPFVKYYTDGDDIIGNFNIKSEKGKINLLTCHKSKGLEFKMTIIINFHLHTMSTCPTQQNYDEYVYLWYVALSRAKEELIICCEKDKYIFNKIKDIPSELYNLYDSKLNKTSYKISNNFNQEYKPLQISVTEAIKNIKIFTESYLLKFQKSKYYTTQEYNLYSIKENTNDKNNDYSILYGNFIERLFMFYYYEKTGNRELFIKFLENQCHNIIMLPEINTYAYSNLKKYGFIDDNNVIYLKDQNLQKYANSNKSIDKFLEYCKKMTENDYCYVFRNDPSKEWDQEKIKKDINNLLNIKNDIENNIFDIILYFYQFKFERLELLNTNFTNKLKILKNYYEDIKKTAMVYDNLKFEYNVQDNNIPLLYGCIDIIDQNTDQIIELKFTNEISLSHELQVYIYYHLYYLKFESYDNYKKNKTPCIINLKTGTQRIITIDDTKHISFNKLLSDIFDRNIENFDYIYECNDKSKIESTIINLYKYCDKIRFIASNKENMAKIIDILKNNNEIIINKKIKVNKKNNYFELENI